jgi:hypothetical protein
MKSFKLGIDVNFSLLQTRHLDKYGFEATN